MKLQKLILSSFKGIKSFTLDAQGENISVFGDNATGKTTVYDAFLWLLFDKDSQNKKDFEIKTIGDDGQHIHGLDHAVEATLEVEGNTITLKKVYKEKWTKKRGSAKAEFTGHTTDYHIDGVPVKKSEYEAKITEIADEDIFKLLTSPTYFNEQLHWQDRRKILLQICGDISDEEVISSEPELAKLPEILRGRKIDDHRKVIASKRAEINKELERIPIRIDEVQRSLPDVSEALINQDKVKKRITGLKDEIKAKEQQISRIESGGEVAEKTKREVEGQLLEIKNQYRGKNEKALQDKQDQYNKAREQYLELKGDIRSNKQAIDYNQQKITDLEKRMADLRDTWFHANQQQFEYEQDGSCPTCGQMLPEEKLAAARDKALAEFNQKKAEQLEQIQAEGKQLKTKANELATENEKAEKQLNEATSKLESEEKKVQELQEEIEKLRQKMNEFSEDQAYIEKLREKEQLEQSIADLKAGRNEEIRAIRTEITELESEVNEAENQLNEVRRYDQGQERTKELKEQERKLAAEYEKLESELYLTEQFIRTKVQLLEEKINSRFEYARFKLFDIQINGGLVETCETLYNHVPYSTGLNNAAKINVGLDIINTLSEFYGFTAPIFIDNREAVTRIIETKGQVISLVVSEKDKSLRVEATGQQQKLKEVI